MNESLVTLLYEEHHAGLRRYGSKLIGAEYVDDVINDVFVQLHEHGNAFVSSHKDVHTYLYRSVRNKCIDMLRRISFQRTIPISEIGDVEYYPDIDIMSITRDSLYKAIETLPPRMKEIVKLGYIQHYTNEEIGAKLGIAHQTVRNEKSTALKKLRKLLMKNIN